MSRRLIALVAALAAATLGYLLVALALASNRAPAVRAAGPMIVTLPTRAIPALLGRDPGPGSGGGSRRTPVSTALSYLQALQPAAASAGRRAVIRALTAAPLTGQALRAQAAGAALWRALGARGPVLARGWPLGYRVDSFGPSRARLTIWTVGLVASKAEVVAPTWSRTACTLVRVQGAWRVVSARTSAGPTPPTATTAPQAVALFVREAESFQAVGDGP